MAASYPWIKLWLDILRDPKMGRMSDRLFRRSVEMFLFAGDVNDGGTLPTLADMAWGLRITPEQLETELRELAAVGIVHRDEMTGRWFVTNFAKRQSRSTDAERMRRYRARKKKQKEEKEETDPYTDDVYRSRTRSVTVREHRNENVTDHNATVTERNATVTERNVPATDDQAVDLILDLQEFWLDLTGGSLPSANEPRVNDYFMPLNRLLLRVGWDMETAESLLQRARLRMLADGKTPYRPAAVIPVILAEIDSANAADSGLFAEPANNPTDVRFDRIFATND